MNTNFFDQRRILTLVVLITAVCLLWAFAIKPMWIITKQSLDDLNDARFELNRLRAISENKDISVDIVRKENEQVEEFLFPIKMNEMNDSQFMSVINKIIRDSGVHLSQITALEIDNSEVLVEFSADVNVNGTETQISKILTAIESNSPLLIIDSAVLLSRGNPISEADVHTAPDLSLQFKVIGFGSEGIQL